VQPRDRFSISLAFCCVSLESVVAACLQVLQFSAVSIVFPILVHSVCIIFYLLLPACSLTNYSEGAAEYSAHDLHLIRTRSDRASCIIIMAFGVGRCLSTPLMVINFILYFISACLAGWALNRLIDGSGVGMVF